MNDSFLRCYEILPIKAGITQDLATFEFALLQDALAIILLLAFSNHYKMKVRAASLRKDVSQLNFSKFESMYVVLRATRMFSRKHLFGKIFSNICIC